MSLAKNQTKSYFYHIRGEDEKPVATVFLFLDFTLQLHTRGIAMCSMMDETNKKIGSTIAMARALPTKNKLPLAPTKEF